MAPTVEVDVIIPVHNAERTLREALDSVLAQLPLDRTDHPQHPDPLSTYEIVIYICCHDDASTDQSLDILREYQTRLASGGAATAFTTELLVSHRSNHMSRGAGYARNRAVDLRNELHEPTCFLCMLDSDDVMSPYRVAEQVHFMMTHFAVASDRDRALLGTQFTRDPPDASWHYARWANDLSDDRLYLERFREVTLIQPTWMMSRQRFQALGGYVQAPEPSTPTQDAAGDPPSSVTSFRLIHPTADHPGTLRLAEDLRFFHAHLEQKGTLHLLRRALVVYRQLQATPCSTLATTGGNHHAALGCSQSSQTSRKLLLQLRVLAFEETVLKRCSDVWHTFVVWGAGRDGKDFCKMLSDSMRQRICCFVDVDEKKIAQGYYVNREIHAKIPIVHFSLLIQDKQVRERLQARWLEGDDDHDPGFGRITKAKPEDSIRWQLVQPVSKKQRRRALYNLGNTNFDMSLLPKLPVVVCVPLYRTNGALERNVATITRTEGENLWHVI